ncbi:hypothetical protein ABTM91_20305, partial [Acinetobacter baumannii]
QESLSAFTLVQLVHLQNEYKVKFAFDANGNFRKYKANSAEEEGQLPYFRRLMLPPQPKAGPRKKDLEGFDKMTKLMLWAMYADQIPID